MASLDDAFDPLLAGFCQHALLRRFPLRVAFTVGGHLITGNLITFQEYLERIEHYFAERGRATEVELSQMISSLRGFADEELREVAAAENSTDFPDMVCLSDVILEGPHGSREPAFWSIRASAITGWCLVPELDGPPLPDAFTNLSE